MLENNLHRMYMLIIGVGVLGLIVGMLYVAGKNPNASAKDGMSLQEQSTLNAIERSESRTPKY